MHEKIEYLKNFVNLIKKTEINLKVYAHFDLKSDCKFETLLICKF